MPAAWEGQRPFVPFGPDHLAALALTGLVVAGLVRLVRRDPEGRAATAVRGYAKTLWHKLALLRNRPVPARRLT